jgi:hypothetical protein
MSHLVVVPMAECTKNTPMQPVSSNPRQLDAMAAGLIYPRFIRFVFRAHFIPPEDPPAPGI